jgi:hypothetical protein
MGTSIYKLCRTAAALALLSMAYACAVTTDATESSSRTFHNTTDASSKFTSSTSPGGGSADLTQKEEALAFSKVKLERIKTDIALGGGEHLTTLATLLGVPAHNQQEFFALTKTNFSTLAGAQNTTAEQLLAGIDNELSANPNLLE